MVVKTRKAGPMRDRRLRRIGNRKQALQNEIEKNRED
jgi:hypothetical protein